MYRARFSNINKRHGNFQTWIVSGIVADFLTHFCFTANLPPIPLVPCVSLSLSLMFVLDALLPVTSSCNLPSLHRLSHPAKVWYLTLWIHHIHHQFMLYKWCALIYSTTPWIQLRYCCYPSVHFAFLHNNQRFLVIILHHRNTWWRSVAGRHTIATTPDVEKHPYIHSRSPWFNGTLCPKTTIKLSYSETAHPGCFSAVLRFFQLFGERISPQNTRRTLMRCG